MNKLPIYDPNIIEDGDNVPSEGGLFEAWEKKKYGGPPKRIEPKKPFFKSEPNNYQRNKELFMSDREKEETGKQFLQQHGINF